MVYRPQDNHSGDRRQLFFLERLVDVDHQGIGSSRCNSERIDKGRQTLADSILDRVVHRDHRIKMKGPNMRGLPYREKKQGDGYAPAVTI